MGSAVSDLSRLAGEVNHLRTELRNIKTVNLRAAIDQAELDVSALQGTVSTLVSDLDALELVVGGLGGFTPVGGIILWSGSIGAIPTNWALCDGTGDTPNLTDRFVVGAGNSYSVGDTGGADSVTLTTAQMPSHVHTMGTHSHGSGTLDTGNQSASHTHSLGNDSHSHSMSVLFKTANAAGGGGSDNGGSSVAQGTPTGRFNGTQSGTTTSDSHGHSIGNQSASHSHTISGSTSSVDPGDTNSAGSGNSHENRPPYYALAYIMRIA